MPLGLRTGNDNLAQGRHLVGRQYKQDIVWDLVFIFGVDLWFVWTFPVAWKFSREGQDIGYLF